MLGSGEFSFGIGGGIFGVRDANLGPHAGWRISYGSQQTEMELGGGLGIGGVFRGFGGLVKGGCICF